MFTRAVLSSALSLFILNIIYFLALTLHAASVLGRRYPIRNYKKVLVRNGLRVNKRDGFYITREGYKINVGTMFH